MYDFLHIFPKLDDDSLEKACKELAETEADLSANLVDELVTLKHILNKDEVKTLR